VFKSNISATLLLLILFAATVCGQQKTRVVDGRVEIGPEEMESERQKYERLKKPDFLTLHLSEITDEAEKKPREVGAVYKSGATIKFHLVITNTSTEPVELRFSDTYNQNRLSLVKDGQEVISYRNKILRLVRDKDKETVVFSDYPVLLDGHNSLRQTIDLREWYGRLEPGRYELTVRHLFVVGGEWMESSPISFEVQPR